MVSAGGLVTGLLSCSPDEVVRVPGNKVNNPNIVEEDTSSVSHQGCEGSSKHHSAAHPSTQRFCFCWGIHSPSSPPAVHGLSGDGLLAAHTAARGWADSPALLSFLSRGGDRAGNGVL